MLLNRRQFLAGSGLALSWPWLGAASAAVPRPGDDEPPLPPGALRRIGSTRMRCKTGVTFRGCDPLNRWIIFESRREDRIEFWSLETGRILRQWHYHTFRHPQSRVQTEIDGDEMLSIHYGDGLHYRVQHHRLTDGQITQEYTRVVFQKSPWSYLDPPSHQISTAGIVHIHYDDGMGAFDLRANRYLWQFEMPEKKFTDHQKSDDGRWVALLSEKLIYLLNSEGLVRTLPRPETTEEKQFRLKHFSRDGRWLLGYHQERVWCVDTHSGKSGLIEIPQNNWQYTRFLDLTENRCWFQFQRTNDFILDLTQLTARKIDFPEASSTLHAVSPDGSLGFSGLNEGIIGVWDLKTGLPHHSSAFPPNRVLCRQRDSRTDCYFRLDTERFDIGYLLATSSRPVQLQEDEVRLKGLAPVSGPLVPVQNISDKLVSTHPRWRVEQYQVDKEVRFLITNRETGRDLVEIVSSDDGRRTVKFTPNGDFALLSGRGEYIYVALPSGHQWRVDLPPGVGLYDDELSGDGHWQFCELLLEAPNHRLSQWYNIAERRWMGPFANHGPRSFGRIFTDHQGRNALYMSEGREEEKKAGLTESQKFLVRDERGRSPVILRPDININPAYISDLDRHGRVCLLEIAQNVYVVELASQQVRWKIDTEQSSIDTILSPDQRSIMLCGVQEPILEFSYWHWLEPGEVRAADFDSLWEELRNDDAGRAFRAMRQILHHPPTALAFLQAKARPPEPADEAKTLTRIEQLSAPDQATRLEARAALRTEGEAVFAILRRVLPATEVEAQEQIKNLLDDPHQPDRFRMIRAVELCELIDLPAARKLLETWANLPTDSTLRHEARWSLGWY
ncbi:MAG: hypothetical protein ACRC8S_05020 [Fimbriiglobus sp.]